LFIYPFLDLGELKTNSTFPNVKGFFFGEILQLGKKKKEVAKGTKGIFMEKMGPSCHGMRGKSPKVAPFRY
jgi:hypothetical protein